MRSNRPSIVISIVVSMLSIFPLIWMVVSGFKSEAEILAIPFRFLPRNWTLENYRRLFSTVDFVRSIGMTFLVASVTTVSALFFNSLAAYAFARLDFRFKRVLWAYTIIPLFVPHISILVPSFIIVTRLGIVNTIWVLILPFMVNAFGIFFIRQFFLNVPVSYEEAAIVDGATRLQIYYKIFLPLGRPPMVLIGVFGFLGIWNSFAWPVVTILDRRLFQIMQLLAFFRGEYVTQTSMIVSGTVIAAIPTIVLFLIFQKYIVEGIKISGLK